MTKWALLALSACASTTGEVCPWGNHDFVASYTETAGNCGPINPESVPLTYDWSEGGKCTGAPVLADVCQVTLLSHCTELDGVTSDLGLALRPRSGAMVGSADISVTWPDGTACRSDYMVRLEPQ